MLIYFHEKPLNKLPTTCASSAIYFSIHTCTCKEGRKNKKGMTRRVANKQRKQHP